MLYASGLRRCANPSDSLALSAQFALSLDHIVALDTILETWATPYHVRGVVTLRKVTVQFKFYRL